MILPNLSQNSMTFPEIPENFKIPEIPWLFHDRGNPVLIDPIYLYVHKFSPPTELV